MSRTAFATLLIGWLLGIATAMVVPTLIYERQSVYWNVAALDAVFKDGWYVIRTEGPGNTLITVERARVRIPTR